MAWLAGWDKRIELPIDYTNKIGASVTWFPVTIHLKNANGDSTKVFLEVGTNSRKIAITKTDGETELKGGIEKWSYDAGTPANSTAAIHTSADGWVIDSNTKVYLYYDKDHADNDNINVIDTAAGAAVWDANFKAVYHMVDATTSTVKDSTSNNNDGTKKAAEQPASAVGKVGLGQDFDGSDDYISIADSATLDLASGFTISCWLNIADNTGTYTKTIIGKTNGTSGGGGYQIAQTGTSLGANKIVVYLFDGSAPSPTFITTDTISLDTWVHLTVTWDGTTDSGSVKVYFDNVSKAGAESNYGTSHIDNALALIIGTYSGAAGFLNGIVDEIEVSDIARSDAWKKGSYNSLLDTLLTYGDEETASILLELSETLSFMDTITTSGTLAKAETLSIVDTWGALITFLETLSITDSEEKSGELDLDETLSITDTWSAIIQFLETLSITDSIIFGTTKQLSESFSITDSKGLTGSLGLTETLGIADSAVYQCIKTLYETLSIIDTKITSGSLSLAETLSIADSWSTLLTLFETLSITDTTSTAGTKTLNELLHLIDTFIRWIEHPIFTEPTKSISSYTEPTKTNPIYTEPAKSNPTFVKPTKSNPVYTEPTKGNPIYTEPTKKIQI